MASLTHKHDWLPVEKCRNEHVCHVDLLIHSYNEVITEHCRNDEWNALKNNCPILYQRSYDIVPGSCKQDLNAKITMRYICNTQYWHWE